MILGLRQKNSPAVIFAGLRRAKQKKGFLMFKSIVQWFLLKRNPHYTPAPSRSILVTSNGLTWAMEVA
jgi:hypothetical protein